jgi:hypothetical protein
MMSMPDQPDDLLSALREARPDPGYQPSPASPEAVALRSRITARPPETERLRPRRLPRRLVLAGIPAIAGAAAAGGIVAATDRSAGPPGPLPGAASVRAAILDAFEQASGDILATVRSIQTKNGPASTERTWSYPMFPAAGQQVRSRVTETFEGQVGLDEESVYIQPKPGSDTQVTGTVLAIEYGNRTWFQGTGINVVSTTSGPSPAQIRGDIASGAFRVAGTGVLDGRRAITLTLSTAGQPKTLWVDARTFVPLQVAFTVFGPPDGKTITVNTVRFQVLAATEANLALLRPAVPAGFTRTTKPPFG